MISPAVEVEGNFETNESDGFTECFWFSLAHKDVAWKNPTMYPVF
jgi:hypothetical protein